jgi:hypothetical protein
MVAVHERIKVSVAKITRGVYLSVRAPPAGLAELFGVPIDHISPETVVAGAESNRWIDADAVFANELAPTAEYCEAVRNLLARIAAVRFLALGPELLPAIPLQQCRTVSFLGVNNTAKTALPACVFEELEVLHAAEARLTFVATQLPALERLKLMLGSKRMWRELIALPKLWALQVGPMDDAGLANMSELPLEILIARRGPLADLSALRRYPKLTEFGAILCQELRDLSPLADVPALTDLTLHDCAHLEKVDSLLALPNLQRAMIWGCRDPHGDLLRVVRTLRERGVEVLSELDA